MAWESVFQYFRDLCPYYKPELVASGKIKRDVVLESMLKNKSGTVTLIEKISNRILEWRRKYSGVAGLHFEHEEVFSPIPIVGIAKSISDLDLVTLLDLISDFVLGTTMCAFKAVVRLKPSLDECRKNIIKDVQAVYPSEREVTTIEDFYKQVYPGVKVLQIIISVIIFLQENPSLERTKRILLNSKKLIFELSGTGARTFLKFEEILKDRKVNEFSKLFQLLESGESEYLSMTNDFIQLWLIEFETIPPQIRSRIGCTARSAITNEDQNAVDDLVLWYAECLDVFWV